MLMCALLDGLRLVRRPEWSRDEGHGRIRPGKVSADNSEPAVVFLIGIRINRWRAVRRWLPLLLSLPGMLLDLVRAPDSGLLGYRLLLGPGPRQAMIIQYWRGAEELHRFARGASGSHRPAQRRYWWHYGDSDAVGVWHEFLAVPEGKHHSMYGNMPPAGIGATRPVRAGQWWAQPARPDGAPRPRSAARG
jgi:fumigallin biosynthesis monooxygenase-like protein